MFFIEQFRVKLHAEERTRAVLHRLDARDRVGRGTDEIGRQLLNFITMRLPNREGLWQSLKNLVCRLLLEKKKSTSALIPAVRPRGTLAARRPSADPRPHATTHERRTR